MGKSKNFSGQPIFNQLIKFIDKSEIKKIAKQHGAERYVKKFSTYNHIIVVLFVAFEGYHSIREAILGLLANAHKLSHLGLSYLVRRSTFAEANQRRSSQVFGDIYMGVYCRHAPVLADSRLSGADMRRLYIMDSTTISLFKDILKGVGRNPKEGKKKGGIKAHTIIKASENVPCLIRYSEAARHDHMVSVIRQQLMNYIDIYCFLEDPEGSWREIIKENKMKYQNSLFPEMEGAYF